MDVDFRLMSNSLRGKKQLNTLPKKQQVATLAGKRRHEKKIEPENSKKIKLGSKNTDENEISEDETYNTSPDNFSANAKISNTQKTPLSPLIEKTDEISDSSTSQNDLNLETTEFNTSFNLFMNPDQSDLKNSEAKEPNPSDKFIKSRNASLLDSSIKNSTQNISYEKEKELNPPPDADPQTALINILWKMVCALEKNNEISEKRNEIEEQRNLILDYAAQDIIRSLSKEENLKK